MEGNDGGPPNIKPTDQKTVPKNETPAIISTAFSNVVMFLEKYGWFVVFIVITLLFIWSKLEPYWRRWKKRHDELIEEANIDPDCLARSQENMERSRRRMQEIVNAKAAERAEKMKEAEDKKRQEKIKDWENLQRGQGRPKRFQNTGYNPLSGGSSGPSYRPSSGRGNAGGG